MPAIELRGVHRSYRVRTGVVRRRSTEKEALRGIDLEINSGELFGLLGPNGAGKTTLIKILTTLLLPTAGAVEVLGFDVVSQPVEVRRRIGYVLGGDRGLYSRLSALDNLRYFAELYRVPPREQRNRIDHLLEVVGLTGRQSERVEGYSRGMRQRLHIARGLLHDPPIVVLDEPSIGIDPVGARELRDTVAALTAVGKTVLLTTHYMYEADELCDRIAVIANGAIVAEGTPTSLKAGLAAGQVLEIEMYGAPAAAIESISRVSGVVSVAVETKDQAQTVLVRTERAGDLTSAIMACLDGVQTKRVAVRPPTLEDAYVELVGRV